MAKVLESLREDAEDRSKAVRWGGAAWRAAWREREAWDRRRWNLIACGSVKSVPLHCASGHRWMHRPLGCGYRFCEHCHALDQARKREALIEKFGRWHERLRMGTLTVRNRPVGQLADQVAELEEGWARLQRHPVWSAHVRGGVAVLELTASRDRGWHAHLHVVWDGGLLNQTQLWSAWNDCLGYPRDEAGRPTCGLPDLRARVPGAPHGLAHVAAARYLAHYASKGLEVRLCDESGELIRGKDGKPVDGSLADLPLEMLKEWVRVWWSKRTIRPFGCHLGTPENQEPPPPWDGVLRCPTCGEAAVRDADAERLYALLDENRRQAQLRKDAARWRRRAELRKRGLSDVPF